MEPDQVYTIKQVAEYLKVSYGLIYKWVKSGKLESFTVGNQHRIKGSTVLALTQVTTI